MRRPLRRLLRDQRGLSTVEYVIILALVAVVGFVVWQVIGRTAASRNAGAEGVVDGLHTSSSTEDGAGGGRGGARGGTTSGGTGTLRGSGSTTMLETHAEERAPEDAGLWRWGLVAMAVFGGMIFWLARGNNQA